VSALSQVMKAALRPLAGHRCVGEVRQRGLMCGIELVKDRSTKQPFDAADTVGRKVADQARQGGVIIRPLGDVIVLMPPLGISVPQLQRLVKVTIDAIVKVTG